MFRLIREGAIARLILDRPEARNAITLTGWAELLRLLGDLGDARLLIVRGEGGFCAGADLADFAAMRADESLIAQFRETMRAALDTLRTLPIPTIAVIEGACYGAGVALAMACDLRLAAGNAGFAITPAKIGISYPQEDVHRLVELVGPGQAARLLFTALAIDGAEAARIGLVELCDAGEGPIVEAILANDADSLAALKRGIALAAKGRRSDSGQVELFDALIAGPALAERLEARRRK
ncbi:MAG TPA: enoyl-CoA hydratase/isomerase family protein [Allosphingosinicella sp.]|nr:enoyl-CoA hydratase/isomerase family protein [Allosphingosinicella sp.]